MHIVIIVGSLRKDSVNRKLALAAQGLLPEDATSEIAELHGIPLYDGDLEVNYPEVVTDLRERIRKADGVLIAVPEYNYSVSGVLKNALDWVSRPPRTQPFNQKPVAVMGAGGMGGTVRGQMHLRQIMLYLEAYVMGRPELLLAQGTSKFDGEGNLIDEKSKEQLERFVASFVGWVEKMGV